MIFYFTATGNSKFIAERISVETGDRIIDIAECIQNDNFTFDLSDHGAVGVVIPVYFVGIPMIAAEFLRKLNILKNPGAYFYVVLGCGGATGGAEKTIPATFQAAAVFDVAMVTNYTPTHQMRDAERVKERLDGAEREIDGVIKQIEARDTGVFIHHAGRFPRLLTLFGYPLYKYGRKTAKFTVNDSCTGCGLCEKVCPRGAIKLENGRPVWIHLKCEICLGCLHRCPAAAIDYGKKSAEHGRYLNPRVQFSILGGI